MNEETQFEQTFVVDDHPSIRVHNINGAITVQRGENGVVTVHALVHGRGHASTRVEIGEDEEGVIYARTVHEKGLGILGFLGSEPRKVDYTITAPAACDISIRAVNAGTLVQGVSGEIRAKSVNGRIALQDVAGTMTFRTVNGRVEGERIAGETHVETVNGRVQLLASDLRALTASTVNGGVELETTITDGPYKLTTVNGNVKLRPKGSMQGRVHVKSVAGSVRLNDQRVRGRGRSIPGGPKKQVLEFTSDGPEIHFKSVSGGLRIVTDEEVDLPEAAPEREASYPADRMDLLNRIAAGEITVDEAVAAMTS